MFLIGLIYNISEKIGLLEVAMNLLFLPSVQIQILDPGHTYMFLPTKDGQNMARLWYCRV